MLFDDAKVVEQLRESSSSSSSPPGAAAVAAAVVGAVIYEQRTLSLEDKIAVHIFKWFTIVFLVVGTVCNLLAAFVYSRKRMRKTSYSVYLFTLALVDTCVIWTGNLRLALMFNVDLATTTPLRPLDAATAANRSASLGQFVVDAASGALTSLVVDDDLIWSGFDLRVTSLAACRIHRFLTYYLLQLSSLLLCMLNIDRLIGCVLIMKASRFCKPWIARRVVVYTMVVLLALDLHFLAFMGVDTNAKESSTGAANGTGSSSSSSSSSSKGHILCEPDAENHTYMAFWHAFFYIDASIYCFCPFVVMVLCNSFIIRKIIQSRKSSKKVIVKKRTQKILRHTSSGMLPAEKRLSLILVCISLSFLLFTVPVMVIEQLNGHYAGRALGWNIVLALAYMLMYLNHVINFFFYCFMGPKFRNEIKKLFPVIFGRAASATPGAPSRSYTCTTLVGSAHAARLAYQRRRSATIPRSVTEIQLIESVEPAETLPTVSLAAAVIIESAPPSPTTVSPPPTPPP